MAGPLGIGPRLAVLETAVLPLYDGPYVDLIVRRLEYISPHVGVRELFLRLLVHGMSLAPTLLGNLSVFQRAQ